MTPEGKVKNAIKKVLKSYGNRIYYFMPAMGSFGKSGIPDFVCSVGGKFFAIEAKADAHKNPPTELQYKNIREINESGGVALVIDASSIDALDTYIKMQLRDFS
jgi:hypothetical protein